jgi:hypothetical protein
MYSGGVKISFSDLDGDEDGIMDLVLSETIRSPPRGRQSCERRLRGSSRPTTFRAS